MLSSDSGILQDFRELEWDPSRSKIKAGIHNGLMDSYFSVNRVLYLGCAHGYTVSHIQKYAGEIYAVDVSREVMRHFIPRAELMQNVVPILADASSPDSYSHLVPTGVDVVFQDIAQRDQTGIFLSNCRVFLSPQGVGILCMKAPAANSSVNPESVFSQVRQQLQEEGAVIVQEVDLAPFHSHHRIFVLHLSPFGYF